MGRLLLRYLRAQLVGDDFRSDSEQVSKKDLKLPRRRGNIQKEFALDRMKGEKKD